MNEVGEVSIIILILKMKTLKLVISVKSHKLMFIQTVLFCISGTHLTCKTAIISGTMIYPLLSGSSFFTSRPRLAGMHTGVFYIGFLPCIL